MTSVVCRYILVAKMIFKEIPFPGVYIIEIEPMCDERGFFARSYCRREFEAHGLNPDLVQCSISFNRKKGTLRGMHYQAPPHEEAKIVRCITGAIYDVVIDLRPGSPAYKRWYALELRSSGPPEAPDRYRMLYVPEGFAHGYQTLEDNTELLYQIAEYYHPETARGIRWNDAAFQIPWPLPNPVMSEKDRNYPDFGVK